MLDTLGGVGSKLWTQVKHLLHTTASGLIDGTFYSPLAENKLKLCTVALNLISTARIEQYRALSSPALLNDDGR